MRRVEQFAHSSILVSAADDSVEQIGSQSQLRRLCAHKGLSRLDLGIIAETGGARGWR
jgi:hypothetical protein